MLGNYPFDSSRLRTIPGGDSIDGSRLLVVLLEVCPQLPDSPTVGISLGAEVGTGRSRLDSKTMQGRWLVLVLTRKKDESICIGDDIIITLLDIRGDKVRIGIEAPKSVQVHRAEIYNKIKRLENGEDIHIPIRRFDTRSAVKSALDRRRHSPPSGE